MIDINSTVFLVDGQTEIMAIKAKFYMECGSAPEFRKVGCNGKSVTAEGYASAALGTLNAVLRDRFLHIVCVVDREKRRLLAKNFGKKLRESIIRKVVENTKIKEDDIENKLVVFVPDRMFENWILSDIEGIKSCSYLIKQSCRQKNFEGKNGVRELKNIMKVQYKKLLHAKKLFTSVRNRDGCLNSKSFNIFCTEIGIK
ncbi:MAG: DUF4276 family protein [Candidatus Krumholzibacteriota bacterium]|nr:DUF4276 family protein [Candidatus Krumholzibacteriota bacterium]